MIVVIVIIAILVALILFINGINMEVNYKDENYLDKDEEDLVE